MTLLLLTINSNLTMASTEQLSGVLHYGAYIFINYSDINGNIYFANAEGYNKLKISLKSEDHFRNENILENGLFRILPDFYDADFQKGKSKLDEYRTKDMDEFNLQTKLRESKIEIHKIVSKIDDEMDLNKSVYEKKKGTPVCFEQKVLFLHVKSSKFLCYFSKKSSKYEPDNLAIELTEEFSDDTFFRLKQVYNFQQENRGYIMDGDEIYIESISESSRAGFDPFWHASKSKQILKGENEYEKKELNVSTEKRSPFKIKIFSEFKNDGDAFIQVLDVVWLNYSENQLSLIAKGGMKKDENHFKLDECESSEKFKKFVGNSNGMFTIENYYKDSPGGFIKWGEPYRIKHLPTNMYFSVGAIPIWELSENQDSGTTRVPMLVRSEKHAAMVKFEYIQSTLSSKDKEEATKYIKKDSYFRLSTEFEGKTYWLKTHEVEGDDRGNDS